MFAFNASSCGCKRAHRGGWKWAFLTVLGLATGVCVQPAFAGQVTGDIGTVGVRESDGLIYFTMTGTPSGRPSCATSSYWMIPNETSEAGKRLYATLLSAKLAGKIVTVVGKGTCTRWSDGEDVGEIRVL